MQGLSRHNRRAFGPTTPSLTSPAHLLETACVVTASAEFSDVPPCLKLATAAELPRREALTIPAGLALLSEVELGGWILTGAGGVFTSTEVTRAN